MTDFLRRIDNLLRSDSSGTEVAERLVPVRIALLACAVLGLIAGACTGVYAVANHDTVNVAQLFASSFKVPLLFLLTLLVTFPSLYVFSALLGVELYPPALLRMILSAIVVTLALAASFGPISAFFALSTANYHFIVVLTVLVYGFGGVLGLVFLLRALRSSLERQSETHGGTGASAPEPEPPTTEIAPMTSSMLPALEEEAGVPVVRDEEGAGDPGFGPLPASAPKPNVSPSVDPDPASRNERIASLLFRIWIVVYGLVGAQMAWVLRPFIGDPRADFTLFRARESNFFAAALGHLRDLLF
jgi:hypothetical protein